MRVLVTGSNGHLGEALMRVLPAHGHDPVGIDLRAGPFTTHVGTITDRAVVRRALHGVDAVLHTATLHKPHVATHPAQAFIDTNITGTQLLLEEGARADCSRFVFTSTTSAFGDALRPAPDAPAVWIDETVASSAPKNIYGATKEAAEGLCALQGRSGQMSCIVLRTSRFFPETDDDKAVRAAFADQNAKANEFLFRRVDIEDVATAHLRALTHVPETGFARYVISATSPFVKGDLADLRHSPEAVVAALLPAYRDIYAAAGYRMFDEIDRVYVNARARADLGWAPVYDFAAILGQIAQGVPIGSDLARQVGVKGYHDEAFEDGPYPVI